MNCLGALLLLVVSSTAISGEHRIYEGQHTTIREYPYQVSIQNHLRSHFCSGSLIKANYVLTAAHCIADYASDTMYVKAGSSDLTHGGSTLLVKQFVSHPKYKSGTFDYDAAVITLIRPFTLNADISTVPLAFVGKKPKHGDVLRITGWGETEVVRVPVLDLTACQAHYAQHGFSLTTRMICAGGGAVGPFKGDSGGPVVNEKNKLVGIVGFGNGGLVGGSPSVIIDATHPEIRAFVDNNMK